MDDFSELEGQPEPQQRADHGTGVPWGGLAILVAIVLLVVFAVQNTENANVEFLWFSGEFPLSIVIMATAVATVVITMAAGAVYRRRRRIRRAEKMELRELRGDS